MGGEGQIKPPKPSPVPITHNNVGISCLPDDFYFTTFYLIFKTKLELQKKKKNNKMRVCTTYTYLYVYVGYFDDNSKIFTAITRLCERKHPGLNSPLYRLVCV